jgi:FG-GAP-like repeat
LQARVKLFPVEKSMDKRGLATAMAALLLGATSPALAVETAGPPNILWRNAVTGANKVWCMEGTKRLSETDIMSTAGEHSEWKIVGTGDFDGDSQIDIVWQHASGYTAVWLCRGFPTFVGPSQIPCASDLNWRIRAAGDFDGDGKPDLVWQHDLTRQNAIWLMDGLSVKRVSLIPSAGPRDPTWTIVGAADLNNDGKADLLWRNATGENAVWYMNGFSVLSNAMLQANPILDDKLAGAWRIDGDNHVDLLWHNCTLGLNGVWFMNNASLISGSYAIPPNFDLNWKTAGQDMTRSTLNLDYPANAPNPTAVVTNAPGLRVRLRFANLGGNASRHELQRRVNGSNWTVIQSGISSSQARSLADTQVQSGQAYDYRLVQDDGQISRSASAAIAFPPAFDRGKIILLVDTNLYAVARATMASAVNRLRTNLIGDGWRIVSPHYVSRHDDTYDPIHTNLVNRLAQSNILQILRLDWAINTNDRPRGIILIGHVSIPYSGSAALDGHGNHQGAWPADMLYGQVNAPSWNSPAQDTGVQTNSSFLANWNFPGDGKSGLSRITNVDLFVGRIDFANLPSFGTTTAANAVEANLINQYVSKDENYRRRAPPFPVAVRGVAQGTFAPYFSGDLRVNRPAYRSLRSIFEAAFPAGSVTNCVADPFCQTSTNYPGAENLGCLWGCLAGSGGPDSISAGQVTPDWLDHRSADLAATVVRPEREPHVVFYGLFGSYFMDWNMTNDFMRACLATPNYGLGALILDTAAVPPVAPFSFGAFAAGQPLGQALLDAVNSGGLPTMFAIMGDPTLRMQTLAGVSNLRGSADGATNTLTWSPGEPDCQFYVFKAPAIDGVFTNVCGPTTATEYSEGRSGAIYMVRAARLADTGRGSSYVNISQGAFCPLP